MCGDGTQKLSYTGGSYVNGHFSQMYPGQPIVGANTLMPMYPLYHFHQSQTMGLPAHMFPPTTAGPMTTVPAIMSKPASIAPNTGTQTLHFIFIIQLDTLDYKHYHTPGEMTKIRNVRVRGHDR